MTHTSTDSPATKIAKVLVVDDEEDIVDLIQLHLERECYSVVSAHTGFQVQPLAVEHEPDLVVLDMMLPGIDGQQVMRRLRADTRTRNIPVIMLTAKAQLQDRLTGLESGADDYMTKPFSPRELVLRVQAILRRYQKVVALVEQRVGDFRLDRKSMVVTLHGEAVELTSTEFRLLTVLLDNPGIVHSRNELLNHVWGHAHDSHSRTLDTHIKRLREKLGEHGRHIQTARGQGYMFTEEV